MVEKYKEVGKKVWVMNNHKYAWYCWEKSMVGLQYKLIHIDHHWDSVCDFKDLTDIDHLKKVSSEEEILEITNRHPIELVKEDSFIAPAIIRGKISELHNLCDQEIEYSFSQQFLKENKTLQKNHKDLNSLLKEQFIGKYILDIDLDYFNRKYFPITNNMLDFISNIKKLIIDAEIITIAKSNLYPWMIDDQSDWVWDEELADEIADLVIPLILQYRSN